MHRDRLDVSPRLRPRFRPGLREAVRACVCTGVLALGWAVPGEARAADRRDGILAAYINAAEQLNELDLAAAIAIIDRAIEEARNAGLRDDPSLSQLYAMRGGLVFANGGSREDVEAAFLKAIQLDYHVSLPIELRSKDLQQILDATRRTVQRPAESVLHTPPVPVMGEDVELAVLFNMPLPNTASAVLYWRPVGEIGEFNAAYMQLFGGFAWASVPASAHENRTFEYFFYAFEDGQRVLANRGDKERPLIFSFEGTALPVIEAPAPTVPVDDEASRRKPTGGLPLVFIHLGFGTGFGVAHGRAELTYEQYQPRTVGATYGIAEQACAIERWIAADGELQNATEFGKTLGELAELPSPSEELVAAYDRKTCARRHPVRTGVAPAIFHVAPEIGMRVHPRVVLSVFTRLQVATGSRVFGTDPDTSLAESYSGEVRSADPAGTQLALQSPLFTFAVGAKVRYFLGREDAKFRLFTGGFAGFGYARLRVPMGFANDRNGNSVPDDRETSWWGVLDENGFVDPERCVEVWPYRAGCDETAERDSEYALSQSVIANRPGRDERIDTVRLGPGFVGGLFGVHYQVIKYFAVFAEIDAGVWFPNTTSALFDLTLGPVVTF